MKDTVNCLLRRRRIQVPWKWYPSSSSTGCSCRFASRRVWRTRRVASRSSRRASVRLQSVEINSYKLDHVSRDVADDLTTARRSKSQLVPRFAAVLLLANRTLFCKRGQVVLCQAQAGEARVVGE